MSNHYERLGLPRRFSLDLSELERAYLAASLATHPDFYTEASSAEQQASDRVTAAINEAYSTLKDPYRRAEYLLALDGGPSAAEVKDIPPMFLLEMMELREQIEVASDTQKQSIEADVQARNAALFRDLRTQFDAVPVPQLAIRKQLNCAKYLRSLLRDLRGA